MQCPIQLYIFKERKILWNSDTTYINIWYSHESQESLTFFIVFLSHFNLQHKNINLLFLRIKANTLPT